MVYVKGMENTAMVRSDTARFMRNALRSPEDLKHKTEVWGKNEHCYLEKMRLYYTDVQGE